MPFAISSFWRSPFGKGAGRLVGGVDEVADVRAGLAAGRDLDRHLDGALDLGEGAVEILDVRGDAAGEARMHWSEMPAARRERPAQG